MKTNIPVVTNISMKIKSTHVKMMFIMYMKSHKFLANIFNNSIWCMLQKHCDYLSAITWLEEEHSNDAWDIQQKM